MSEASGIPSWAVPGAKVVCVDDSRSEWTMKNCPHQLQKGAIYIIGAVEVGERTKQLCMFPAGWDGWGARLCRFRPLITRSQEQDVAQFRKLLTDLPERIDA